MKTSTDRSLTKSHDGQFIWELENGFELSPRESELLLETVRQYYCQGENRLAGRVSLWVVKLDSSVGKPLSDCEKIEVWVTVDGGLEDLEAYRRFGHAGLRRQRILRISEEIVEQVGVATQEDLARLLCTSVRTIRRDIAYLRDQGVRVITRGVHADIGRSVSHKATIVELFLTGMVYTEICRRLHHSAKAVKRYVNTFVRIVSLYNRGIRESSELAQYVGITSRLADEYLDLYFKLGKKPQCQERIKEIQKQLASRPPYPASKKGGLI
jgi:transcription initiation factor IIE alpha subunit